jgi:hypothetical protein
VLASIVNTSSGRCWSSDTYNPVPGVMPNVPSSRNYSGMPTRQVTLLVRASFRLFRPSNKIPCTCILDCRVYLRLVRLILFSSSGGFAVDLMKKDIGLALEAVLILSYDFTKNNTFHIIHCATLDFIHRIVCQFCADELILMQAKKAQAALPLGEKTHGVYEQLSKNGMGGKDFSSVYEFLNKNLLK